LTDARPSRLYVPFSEKLDNLLDRLGNEMTHSSGHAGTKTTPITVAA
jgi:hypothetical protein